jgi:hypothetical protein
VPLTVLDVGAGRRDGAGNSCGTFTETDTVSPVGLLPPVVVVANNVATVISYDPTTATGDFSFTNYFGGKCTGATFDKTGATVASTGTAHFAVSERGKRIDWVITSLNTPESAVGSFSLSGTDRRH